MRWWWLALLWGACTPRPDKAPEPDDSDVLTGDTAQPLPWKVAVLAELDAGLQNRIAVGQDGTVYVATFGTQPWQDGVCDEVPTNPPPRMRHDLYLIEGGVAGWSYDTVAQPVVAFSPTGIGLAISPAGNPALAYTGGAPANQYCGGNDAIYSERVGGSWQQQTAASDSGQAATGQPASDSGFVVGLWPALAYDADGAAAIAYRDAHYGSLQHDDLYRADAELASAAGGSWSQEAVDAGEGAGDYSALIFDPEGRPVVVTSIPVDAQGGASRKGVWAARRDASGWQRVQLYDDNIYQEIALGISPSGELAVAFYASSDQALGLRRLPAGANFLDAGAWSDERLGNPLYDEGQGVSLAFSAAGELTLAYHRCRLTTASNAGCDPNDEAVIFARSQGGDWSYDAVVEAGAGSCGDATALAIDADNTAWIAFRCTQEDAGFVLRPYIAWKPL